MPSGFQNNNSQLQPMYYRVQIDSSTWSTTASSNASGCVEPWDYNYFATLNTTQANSERRARGNIRWNNILSNLTQYADAQILDVTPLKTGPAAQTAADDTAVSLAFTVGYYQESYVLGGHVNFLSANGYTYLADGSTLLTTTPYEQLSSSNKQTALQNAIADIIVKAICMGGSSGYTRRYRAYNPTLPGQIDENITVTQPDTPTNVWTKVTVSLIDTMTQQKPK